MLYKPAFIGMCLLTGALGAVVATPEPFVAILDTLVALEPTTVREIIMSTSVVTMMPLASAEAHSQEKAYSKAINVANSLATEVAGVFSSQGKAVPSAVVPDQPKQTEVKHSGLENILEIHKNMDYSQAVGASPEEGYYIRFFNGTNPQVTDDYADSHEARLPHTIFNPSKKAICILGHTMNTETGRAIPFAFNYTKVPMLYLAPNSSVQIGNFLPIGANKHNGRIQPKFGCDKDCKKCAGDAFGAVDTLFEYHHAQNADGSVFSNYNPSNVDGIHSQFNATVFNKDGVCHHRGCHITAEQVKKICPKNRQWHNKDYFGCKSDCKATGRDDHCCINGYGPLNCPPSSQFLHELCPDAYSWAYDDREHSDICDGTQKVHLSFSPIEK